MKPSNDPKALKEPSPPTYRAAGPLESIQHEPYLSYVEADSFGSGVGAYGAVNYQQAVYD